MIYLDAAATTLEKPPQVRQAMAQAAAELSTPGRGSHPAARRAEETAFRCRAEAAALFGVPSPENVVFTMNATHGLNIAIRSLVVPGSRVVISGYEHNAVCRPLYAIPEVRLTVVDAPPFRREQAAEEFRRAILAGADAVIVNHVSNVFGCVQPLEEIAGVCRSRGVPLLVDASQSAGTLPLHLTELGAAFIAMPGTRGFTAPRGRGCCCAANGPPGRCCWAAREAPPVTGRCPRPCRIVWRPAPTICRVSPGCWRDCGSSADGRRRPSPAGSGSWRRRRCAA